MQQKNKAVLVDVREAKYYNKGHASGCLNVGLFRSVEGRTPLDNLKRLAMAGFAMEATGEGRGLTVRKTTQASHCVLFIRHGPNDICSMVLMGCRLNKQAAVMVDCYLCCRKESKLPQRCNSSPAKEQDNCCHVFAGRHNACRDQTS